MVHMHVNYIANGKIRLINEFPGDLQLAQGWVGEGRVVFMEKQGENGENFANKPCFYNICVHCAQWLFLC